MVKKRRAKQIADASRVVAKAADVMADAGLNPDLSADVAALSRTAANYVDGYTDMETDPVADGNASGSGPRVVTVTTVVVAAVVGGIALAHAYEDHASHRYYNAAPNSAMAEPSGPPFQLPSIPVTFTPTTASSSSRNATPGGDPSTPAGGDPPTEVAPPPPTSPPPTTQPTTTPSLDVAADPSSQGAGSFLVTWSGLVSGQQYSVELGEVTLFSQSASQEGVITATVDIPVGCEGYPDVETFSLFTESSSAALTSVPENLAELVEDIGESLSTIVCSAVDGL